MGKESASRGGQIPNNPPGAAPTATGGAETVASNPAPPRHGHGHPHIEFKFFDGGQAAALAVLVLVSISLLYSLVTRALPLERN